MQLFYGGSMKREKALLVIQCSDVQYEERGWDSDCGEGGSTLVYGGI